MKIYFREIAFKAFSAIDTAFKPYLSIRSAGFPDSPKESLTPTNSCGNGMVVAKNWAMESPKPPVI